jgi:hypothetical protein
MISNNAQKIVRAFLPRRHRTAENAASAGSNRGRATILICCSRVERTCRRKTARFPGDPSLPRDQRFVSMIVHLDTRSPLCRGANRLTGCEAVSLPQVAHMGAEPIRPAWKAFPPVPEFRIRHPNEVRAAVCNCSGEAVQLGSVLRERRTERVNGHCHVQPAPAQHPAG